MYNYPDLLMLLLKMYDLKVVAQFWFLFESKKAFQVRKISCCFWIGNGVFIAGMVNNIHFL